MSEGRWVRNAHDRLWQQRGEYLATVWSRSGRGWRFVVLSDTGQQVAFEEGLEDEPHAMEAANVVLDSLSQKDNSRPG